MRTSAEKAATSSIASCDTPAELGKASSSLYCRNSKGSSSSVYFSSEISKFT